MAATALNGCLWLPDEVEPPVVGNKKGVRDQRGASTIDDAELPVADSDETEGNEVLDLNNATHTLRERPPGSPRPIGARLQWMYPA